MKRVIRLVVIVTIVLLAVVLVGPFLVPVPPLQDAVSPEQLADADSQFVEVNGLRLHYKIAGQGEPALLLLHGFAASTFTWREVMPSLAQEGTTIAFDRPAFGLTERPMPDEWQGENPYRTEAQPGFVIGLMDKLGVTEAVLVGNSAGGTVAVSTALNYPERVTALVLVDPAIYAGGGTPNWLRPILRTPQARRLGPLFVRRIQEWGQDMLNSAWHDPAKVTPEVREGYTKLLRIANWDRALWEFTLASHPLGLPDRLNELQMPTLVITGDDDRIVPTEQSVRLAGELPNAELAVIPNCGHVPQEECPEAFLDTVRTFLAGLR